MRSSTDSTEPGYSTRVPEPEANLLAFFQRLPPAEQERVCFLASRLVTA
jgi:hypothetical protein